MDTEYLCLPCLVRQGIDAVSRLQLPFAQSEKLIRSILDVIREADFSVPPPVIAADVQAKMSELTGMDDVYEEEKRESNSFAMGLLGRLEKKIEASEDPFETACRFAIAGNIIDLGVKSQVDQTEILSSIEACLSQPLDQSAVLRFQSAARDAEKILYLCDNAGEIVLDRLLMSQLGPGKVTAVVKSGPILNDATLADARDVGLTDFVEVITNGAAIPGTYLSECSEDFLRLFDNADMIVSKGQANFETLHAVSAPLFFLFKVKCERISRHTGMPLGSIVIADTMASVSARAAKSM